MSLDGPEWRESLERHCVPATWRDPLLRYFNDHIAPDDDLLIATLQNEASDVAFTVTRLTVDDFVNTMVWLMHAAPAVAWGSLGAYSRWVDAANTHKPTEINHEH